MNPAGTHFFLFEFFCLKAVTKGSCGPVKPEHFQVIFLTVFLKFISSGNSYY